jgi:hypothetical protein
VHAGSYCRLSALDPQRVLRPGKRRLPGEKSSEDCASLGQHVLRLKGCLTMHGSLAQHEIEKAQKEKADVTQKTDKFAKEETKVDFDRTTKKRIDAVRDQIENGPKSLAILNDRFTHGQVR